MIIEARKNPNGMNAVQVIEVIKDLAKSQGFYDRLLREIKGFNAIQMREFIKVVEEQNFKDAVDVVMYFEC